MSEGISDIANLKALLDTAVDAIITIESGGLIKSLNPAAERLFGYGASEIIGKNIHCLMPAPWASLHDDFLARYQQTGEKRVIGIGREVEGLRKDGTTFPMQLSVGEYEVDGARFFTGIIHDLSRRKKVEAASLNAEKLGAIGQLSGGIAHDFNNLLTVIVGNLELLDMQTSQPGEKELIADALDAAQLGADLTKRLLAFSSHQILEPHQVNVNSLIDGFASLIRRTLGGNIVFSTSLADGLWTTLVDPGQVENALLNLAVNARDAMPDGGDLLIETTNIEIKDRYLAEETGLALGDYVRVSVIDAGTGMSADTLNRVFEPFFTTKGFGKGTGLGLSMVHGFAKQSGGHVTVYSELELGTTINLYLPRFVGQKDTAPAHSNSDQTTQNHLSGTRILVVEDNEQVRRLSVQRLIQLGCKTLEAENGAAALSILNAGETIDLVFTDLIMPGGMSGYQLSETIRTKWPNLPVVLTSGYAEDLLHSDVLVSQSLRLLRKPYGLNELIEFLNSALDRSDA